jgi:glycerate 2-kinase
VRVLICPDRMGPLSSAAAGRVLGSGWPDAITRTAGEAGRGFAEATADGWGSALQTAVLDGVVLESARTVDAAVLGVTGVLGPAEVPGAAELGAAEVPGVSGIDARARPESPIPFQASSFVLGQAIRALLAEDRPKRLLVDLAGLDVHDAGAGLLASLGARSTGGRLTDGVSGLTGLTAVDLAAVRSVLADVELIGVVPAAERDDQLLGLRGITSRRGRAAGEDAAVLLATDAALQQLTEQVAPEVATTPGAGACGGLGWTTMALGGRLATGPELGLVGAGDGYDLVVTGCGVFDFATRGGGVVAAAAELAAAALAPCIVIAGEVLIGAREMRTMGIEAAYAVRESNLDAPTGGNLTANELAATVTRVSRSWRW